MTAPQTFRAEAAKRILIKDGPYGTAIQDRAAARAPIIAAASTC